MNNQSYCFRYFGKHSSKKTNYKMLLTVSPSSKPWIVSSFSRVTSLVFVDLAAVVVASSTSLLCISRRIVNSSSPAMIPSMRVLNRPLGSRRLGTVVSGRNSSRSVHRLCVRLTCSATAMTQRLPRQLLAGRPATDSEHCLPMRQLASYLFDVVCQPARLKSASSSTGSRSHVTAAAAATAVAGG